MANGDDLSLPTASLTALRRRWLLMRRLRRFFEDHGYWEVETPLLSRDSCIDAWLDPFLVPLPDGGSGVLQTSPEFAMKRLVCAGADRIYQATRSFRRDEVGPRHNPEFAIVEWYVQGEDHLRQMEFVEELTAALCEEIADTEATIPSRPLSRPFHRLTYATAFERFAGVSPLTASIPELQAACHRAGITVSGGEEIDRDDLLNVLLAELVEPGLKNLGPVFLYDYPASQAALARIDQSPAPTARRFELYLDGLEICNGYHELGDAEELLGRMREQNAKRQSAGKELLPEQSRLISAMQRGLPDCAGVALGFDRIAMWRLGLPSIQEIVAFPFDRA